jgi:prefoldin subunit 5
MGGSYSKYDVDASLENAYEMLNNHVEELNKLSSWREEVDNKIKAIDMRISLCNNTQSTGSSADVQSLLKKR